MKRSTGGGASGGDGGRQRGERATVVLVGFESTGKSALFRGLSGRGGSDETNFRGSSVVCRTARIRDTNQELVDTPGIRLEGDGDTARLALEQVDEADVVLLVARGTHARSEIEGLLARVKLDGTRAALVITFEDKAPPGLVALRAHYERSLGIPAVIVNARKLETDRRRALLAAIDGATPPHRASARRPPLLPTVEPARTVLEHPWLGPWVSLVAIVAMFAGPVYAAYLLADALEPLVDRALIAPMVEALGGLPATASAMLVGDYGVLTLGWYSLLWAFPVVLFVGVSVALAEETGLKDRMTAALDPWLRRIGLSGRDLIPVLSGFGCNVVAVFQSRSCSSCTRKACVSLIAFGSACSYQIGASLSIFNAAGRPWLFAPYLALLFFVGALHGRLWHGALPAAQGRALTERAFLQPPAARAMVWRVRAVVAQFLLQAMPIFLGICLVAALLQEGGVIDAVARGLEPLLGALFDLPGEVASGILFSILRKDGLLTLNSGEGSIVATLGTGQLLVLVYLASTLTACLVTLWTVRRELGGRHAAALAARQALTAVATTLLLAQVVSILG